jgi:hypothetical protein
MSIEDLISRVRARASRERHGHRTQQEIIEQRRETAMRRIGQAAIDHDLPVGQDLGVDKQMERRLYQAQKARVSEAEAMADLAEHNGDIVSELEWRDLQTRRGATIWRGYVVRRRAARCRGRFTELGQWSMGGPIYVDVCVRLACYGAYLAEWHVEDQGVLVGLSEGEHASVHGAVTRAYVAYFGGVRGVLVEAAGLPVEFCALDTQLADEAC